MITIDESLHTHNCFMQKYFNLDQFDSSNQIIRFPYYLSAKSKPLLFYDEKPLREDDAYDVLGPVDGVRLDEGQRAFQDVVRVFIQTLSVA
jgi:hypothetical protein